MKYEIDFFELMFLAESVIPPNPIARSMCFDDFSEKHYHNMNDNQRSQFFEHVIKQDGFNLENEQCRHFFARFNTENQYLVTCFFQAKAQEVECYRFDEQYKTQRDNSINPEYITKIVKKNETDSN